MSHAIDCTCATCQRARDAAQPPVTAADVDSRFAAVESALDGLIGSIRELNHRVTELESADADAAAKRKSK